MSDIPVDPIEGTRWVLSGRIVTMNGQHQVIDDGRIYMDGGLIAAVQPAAAPKPAGFEDSLIVNTGDTIYPGLIELHNHLSYNALTQWMVPKLYSNRSQWGRHRDYRKLISGPMSVLGRAAGFIEAVVRYVEAKCLLGGVTTSQGIALFSNSGVRRYYRGMVRNVEETNDPRLPEAATRIADVEADDAAKFLERLERSSTLLLHLAEGLDDRARAHFKALKISGSKWAITPALAGIHCAGLRGVDYATLRSRGGSMVWSPLSNLLLYGGTADIARAVEEGVLIGLGSDWSPSGSKNLLGELKVAALQNTEAGGPLSSRDIVAMATTNAARILKWDAALGSIEPGKLADFVAVNGKDGDPYDHLISARETSLTLVVINGVRRYGQQRLMADASDRLEDWRVGDSQRLLNFVQDNVDPLIGELSLTMARDRLTDGLNRLPELALQLENPVTASAMAGVAVAGEAGNWYLELDHEGAAGFSHRPRLPVEGVATGHFEPAAGATPLSQILEPLQLDPLTIADDETFFDRLERQGNLPDAIKRDLPTLYGLPPGTPQAAPFGPGVIAPAAAELSELGEAAGPLTLEDRRTIVDQALLLLDQVYVHLTLKRAMHAVDPIQRLRLLQHRLSLVGDQTLEPEQDFHNEMTEIFTSVRDLHTNYLLPFPYRDRTAYLPFLIEEFFDGEGNPHYMVSKVTAGFEHPTFVPGVEVLYWNGTPVRRVIELNAMRQAGSNPDARFARGLDALSIRPLIRMLPPDEEWVDITYKAPDGRELQIRREWRLLTGPLGLAVDPDAVGGDAAALGFDIQTDAVNQAKKLLYAPEAAEAERRGTARAAAYAMAEDELATPMPGVFRAKAVGTRQGDYAYVRIFTFNVSDADAFVGEFIRLIEELPQDGLIIDVRGNGGGLIYAAERLLQVLTPQRIRPQRAQFVTTPLALDLCLRHAPSPLDPGFDLAPWIESIRQSVGTGAVYSLGHPITDEASANRIGQRYYGPVVLITDALCYSATDMFAAGFQDHAIGTVLGTSNNTGAGGANVWTHGLIRLLAETAAEGLAPDRRFRDLPNGAGMRVSVRRTTRVGRNEGEPVEDLGVQPDVRYHLSRRDLIDGNAELIATAAKILGKGRVHAIGVDAKRSRQGIELDIHATNIDRVDIAIGGRPYRSLDIKAAATRVTLERAPKGRVFVDLDGYLKNELVARRRQRVA